MRPSRLAAAVRALTRVAACEDPPAENRAEPSEGSSVRSGEATAPPSSSQPPIGPPAPSEPIPGEEAAAAGVVVHMRQLTEHPPAPVVPTERNCLLFGTSDSYI